jgi:hypothetical protein
MALQKSFGLVPDGVVGAQTMKALDELYNDDAVGAAKGVALIFGLNEVDPGHYGSSMPLRGCHADAHDLEAILSARGLSCTTFLSREATSGVLMDRLARAARELGPGDLLVLCYSGHGGQVPNTNGDDEADDMDETWCMFDREVVDDELFGAFSRFGAGVRILVLSDSCHSGTVVRMREADAAWRAGAAIHRADVAAPVAASARSDGRRGSLLHEPPERDGPRAPGTPEDDVPVPRAIPLDACMDIYNRNRVLYDTIQSSNPLGDRAGCAASVLLISGCQDHQLSGDLPSNGVFTGTLKRVWNNGGFDGTHRQFHAAIAARMPSHQQPNLFTVGAAAEGFVGQRPFTI